MAVVVAVSRSVDMLSISHRAFLNFLYLNVLRFFLSASGQGEDENACNQATRDCQFIIIQLWGHAT